MAKTRTNKAFKP